MRKMGIAICLYMAVCKNTDDLYIEIITLNPEHADQYIDRGEKLIQLPTPPKKISESPGFWKCTWCEHRPVCHMKRDPDRNCRTCKYIQLGTSGTWSCTHPTQCAILSTEAQMMGCKLYKMADYYR
jgi:hypothetical protein